MAPDIRFEQLKHARILLVEDSEINQLVAKKLLNHLGVLVTIANNGSEAVDLLKDSPRQMFDMILMDIQMPIMGGREAARHIRQMKGPNRTIPIIAVSASASEDEEQMNLACGINAHIPKPIDLDDLLTVLPPFLAGEKKLPTTGSPQPQSSGAYSINIPGIDTASGLNRVVGNLGLYQELLENFAANNRESMRAMYQNFHAGNHRQNEFIAHSLKGTSGTLGVMELFFAAEHIEQTCRDGTVELIQLKQFDHTLTETIAHIDQYFARNATDKLELQPAKSTDHTKLVEQISQLMALLHNHDADALETLCTIKEESELPDPQAFLAIDALIHNLDFQEAAVQLEAYLQHIS